MKIFNKIGFNSNNNVNYFINYLLIGKKIYNMYILLVIVIINKTSHYKLNVLKNVFEKI